MAKIIIMTSGLTGILNASYELSNRLQKAGHHVVLASPRPLKEKVEAQGFAFYQLPEVIKPFQPQKLSGNRFQRILGRWQNRKSTQQKADNYYHQSGLDDLNTQLQPDLLLIDVELHTQIFTAYSLGINFVLLSQWYSLLDFAGLPYLLNDTIPNTDWRSSNAGLKWQWWMIKLKRSWVFKKAWLKNFGSDRRSSLKRLAKAKEIPRKYISKNFWPGPFTYQHLPILSMAPKEMEFPYNKPSWQHYVGPMVYAERKEQLHKSLNGYSIEQILAIKKESRKRLIVCTVSTMRSQDLGFLKKVVAAVASNPQWMLVLSIGQSNERFDEAENIYPFSYLPQLTFLAQADLSINHGGIHTIHECIHFEVPMLVYNGKKSDQPGCAARVHYHKLGIMADKDLDGVETIYQKIHLLFNSKKYKTKTQQMRKHLTYYKQECSLEKIVQQQLHKQAIKGE